MDISWELVAIVVVVGADKILGTLRDRGIDLRKLCQQQEDLHKWHDREDADGVKVWYIRKSLITAIDKLAENIANQTELLREINKHHEQDRSRNAHDRSRLDELEAQLSRRSEL